MRDERRQLGTANYGGLWARVRRGRSRAAGLARRLLSLAGRLVSSARPVWAKDTQVLAAGVPGKLSHRLASGCLGLPFLPAGSQSSRHSDTTGTPACRRLIVRSKGREKVSAMPRPCGRTLAV